MRTDTITLKPGETLTITTPLGRIRLTRVVHADPRKMELEYPDIFSWVKGDKPTPPSLVDGGKPTFDVLVPEVNDQGELVGVRKPTGFHLTGDPHGSKPAMA